MTIDKFNLNNTLIPEEEIIEGGPGIEVIPAIDKPKFENADKATFINDSDRVIGVTFNGISKAYPVKIMNWHEIVNDTFDGYPVAVTFCPLCGSGMAFNALINNKQYTFGVSGLLYNNNLLFHDRESDNLWSQILKKSISGELKCQQLDYIETMQTSWKRWRQLHPETKVLSISTGYMRYYDREPYTGYEKRDQIFFPVKNKDERFHPKTWTLGIDINGKKKAYPVAALPNEKGEFEDSLEGKELKITYNKKDHFIKVAEKNSEITSVLMYWFTWAAFFPDSEVFSDSQT